LPAVAYLTVLDKYAIVNIVILCFLSCWHAIIGSFWDVETARQIDQWVLVAFGAGFIGVNLVFVFWYFIMVRYMIIKLKRIERSIHKNV
jgi:hypothetical protein